MGVLEFSWGAECPGDISPVYMGAAYQRLFADYDGSEPRVLICRRGERMAYLPLLVRDLGNGVREAYSAYGYGGLLGDIAFSEQEVRALAEFLARSSIVCAFIRHSPFLANDRQFPVGGTELNRRTYGVTLAEFPFEDCVGGMSSHLRRCVSVAHRSGLVTASTRLDECPPERIFRFHDIYAALMRAKTAREEYLFPESFFLDHARKLGSSCDLVEVVDRATGTMVAGAFFLRDATTGWVHYHLGAGLAEAMKLQAMKLLFVTAICSYGRLGYRALHLGGGHALDESDGLSRFKALFADRRLDYHCSKIICNQTAYCAERTRLPLTSPGLFLIGDARGVRPEGHRP